MGDEFQGGCYCGALRYRVSAAPVLKAECHCRACQHISGGGPNYFMLIPPEGFAYVEGEGLMMGIKDLAVSSGSACTSASLEPSYVLRALGVEEELAHTSLRIGLGRFTTEQDVDYAVEHIVQSVQRLRSMSPLWEMAQEGIDIKSIKWAEH